MIMYDKKLLASNVGIQFHSRTILKVNIIFNKIALFENFRDRQTFKCEIFGYSSNKNDI